MDSGYPLEFIFHTAVDGVVGVAGITCHLSARGGSENAAQGRNSDPSERLCTQKPGRSIAYGRG